MVRAIPAAFILWFLLYLALSIPDGLPRKGSAWENAWNCRCDTCCETLDRLEAEAGQFYEREREQR